MDLFFASIGFLTLIVGIIMFVVSIFKKSKKKTSGIVSAVGMVLIIAGLSLPQSENSMLLTDLRGDIDNLEKENEKLNLLLEDSKLAEKDLKKEFEKEIKQINDKVEELEEENKLINNEMNKLEKENKKLTKNNKSLKKDNDELTESNNELTKNAKSLKNKVAELESSNKELNNEITSNKKQQAKSESKTSSNANQQNASSSTKTTKNVTQKTEAKQECNIKGSSSGIYHTPSSSYYSRTTNPVAMFCSVEEAEAAGYRPPKR